MVFDLSDIHARDLDLWLVNEACGDMTLNELFSTGPWLNDQHAALLDMASHSIDRAVEVRNRSDIPNCAK